MLLQFHSSSLCKLVWVRCVHSPSVQRNTPLCTDRFMTGRRRNALSPPDLDIYPHNPLSLGCIFTYKCPILAPPGSLQPPGQAASLTAQCLSQVWEPTLPAHTTLGHLWTSAGRGWRAQGKGGAGPALMQSSGGCRRGGCPHGGWSAAASTPAPRPARAQSELDLVPCSGYHALSARAASLKQLASKNTLGLGSGRQGRSVCFYTPNPHLGIPGAGTEVHT